MLSNLFVEKERVFDIVLYLFEKDGEDAIQVDAENIPPDTEPKKLKFTFRYPNYKDSTQIMSQSFSSNENGEMKIDLVKMQDVAMRALLVSWNLTDKDDKPVTITQQNIDKLNPAIARTLANEMINKIKIT